MDNSLVSIIIPCYNDAQYIEQSVLSAIDQTYKNIEIIVIDDGSNEETKAVLKKLEPKLTKLITQENQGVCVARNNAIEEAKGEYILTLDSDDYFDPKFTEKAVDVIKSFITVGIVSCWAQVIDEKGVNVFVLKPTGSAAPEALYFNNSIGNCLFRRGVWVEVGGYDINLKQGCEDWEFNIAVTKKGWKVNVIPEILFNYRQKKSSRHSNSQYYQREIRNYVFNKHSDVAIQNFDKTLNFFLDEIEKNKKLYESVKFSKSYQIGHMFVLIMKKIFSIFRL